MFQDDNVRNQRENVTLTLANAQSRLSLPNETEPVSSPPFLIWIHLNNFLASGFHILLFWALTWSQMQDIMYEHDR